MRRQIEEGALNKVLMTYRGAVLPTLVNSNGDRLIKPPFRKTMKELIQEALKKDLVDLLEDEVAEVVLNCDGLMIVAANDDEGCYTIEIQVKVKNLDYDAYEFEDEDGE